MTVKLLSEHLQAERTLDGRRRLLRDLVVEVDGETITVPEGFVTDYSSVPQAFAWLVRWSRVDVAGVVHDYLYRVGGVTRKEADLIWRKVAKAGDHSANRVQAWLGWAGLRIGAGRIWRRYRKAAT